MITSFVVYLSVLIFYVIVTKDYTFLRSLALLFIIVTAATYGALALAGKRSAKYAYRNRGPMSHRAEADR